MNEEQTVLDFFSREENLSLALTAAEHLDDLRLKLNNKFWLALNEQLKLFILQSSYDWQCELTEERNSVGTMVGLHMEPKVPQRNYLLPFIEQQLMGSSYRIYYGLMWNVAPEPTQLKLPSVMALRNRFNSVGFKDSDSFLAWQWSPWYPRRRDFLIKLATQQDALLSEVINPLQTLLQAFNNDILMANGALKEAPRSAVVSLTNLHSK